MKKIYALFLMIAAMAFGVSAQTYYNGKLNVEMMGTTLAEDMPTRVSLSEAEDGTYVFRLPDFKIAIGEGEVECGDIVVEGVTLTDGKVAGSVEDLSLAKGEIHAKVDVAGTETAEGVMDLTITVGWYMDYPDDLEAVTPINVTFKGQRGAGVAAVSAEGAQVYAAEGAIVVNGYEGRVNVYTVDGRLVATAQVGESAQLPMAAGLYVVRAGERAAKVVVK